MTTLEVLAADMQRTGALDGYPLDAERSRRYAERGILMVKRMDHLLAPGRILTEILLGEP